MRRIGFAGVGALAGALAGCRPEPFPACDDPEPPLRTDVPTWHGEARAIVARDCAGCHVEGGLAPMALVDHADAATWAPAIAESVTAGTMPPWPPLDCCRPLAHRAALDPADAATLVAWADGGAPEGDPADYVPPEPRAPALDRVDLTLRMPEPYTPAPRDGTTDDTRCFLVDWPIDHDTSVTGFGVRPGAPTQVHHVLALTASAVAAGPLELLDAADAGPGWSCPGGVVLGATGWIGAWSPGWTARELPAGTGQRMDPGDRVVLTVHYSVASGPAVPDRTALDLRLDDRALDRLRSVPVYDPLWLGTLRIPAGDPDVVVRHQLPYGVSGEVVGVNLHLHERGSRGLVGVRHRDGTTDCLLQIDDWDHAWQGDYQLREPLPLADGDRLVVECHFDNSAGNQRVVNGAKEAPRTLGWAEDEEMCVAFVQVR